MQTVLRAHGLYKYFGDQRVLNAVSLDVKKGEAVMVIGRSGSGKTTLLRCLNFLEEPTLGWVEIDSIRIQADPLGRRSRRAREQVRQLRTRAGMLFQEFNLFPQSSVLENLTLAPREVLGIATQEATERAERYLAKVGLSEKRDEYPARLSSGQRQRVAIARALCMEPKILLFDEPTSALDPELIGEVLVVMEELAHEGTTMVVVTHEMHFAREAANRVVFMEEGTIVEEGIPQRVMENPSHPATRRFMRRFMLSRTELDRA